MPNQIEIEVLAKDGATAVLNDIFSAVQSGAGAFEYVAIVANAAASFVKESVKEYAEYAEQVRNLARATGLTSEETSRLIQVADDAQISYTGLMTAMRIGLKNGIDPSVEGLARLSEQYLALAPGAERAQFLMATFGRSGMEMGKMLAIGSDGIKQMNAGIDQNLILSQKSMDEMRKYEASVDALNDAWKALEMQVGQKTIPTLANVVNHILDTERATQMAREQGENYMSMTVKQKDELYKAAAAEREMSNANLLGASAAETAGLAFETEAEQTARLKDEARAAEEATRALSDTFSGYLSTAESIYSSQEDYNQSMDEAIEKYGRASDEVKKLAADHQAAMAQMQYDLLLTKLQAGGLSEEEFNIAATAGAAFGVFDQKAMSVAMAMNTVTSAVANGTLAFPVYEAAIKKAMSDGVVSVEELNAMIASIPKKVDVVVNVRADTSAYIAAMHNLDQYAVSEKGMGASR